MALHLDSSSLGGNQKVCGFFPYPEGHQAVRLQLPRSMQGGSQSMRVLWLQLVRLRLPVSMMGVHLTQFNVYFGHIDVDGDSSTLWTGRNTTPRRGLGSQRGTSWILRWFGSFAFNIWIRLRGAPVGHPVTAICPAKGVSWALGLSENSLLALVGRQEPSLNEGVLSGLPVCSVSAVLASFPI